MDKLKDMLAYLIVIGSKPVPFIFTGLVVVLLNEHLEGFADNTLAAIGLTILASSGVALIGLPPLLVIQHKAKTRYQKDLNRNDLGRWSVAWITGIVLLILWVFLFARYS